MKFRKFTHLTFIVLLVFFCSADTTVIAQSQNDTVAAYTLKQCIDYALVHEPVLRQALIKQDITKADNAISLSGWYPQVGITANLNHYLERPTAITNINGVETPVKTSVINSSTPGASVTQTIFNPSLVAAARKAPLFKQQAQQVTDSTKINVVVNVSKAYYALLLTLQQIDVLKEDTSRLGESMRTAKHQYIGGIVDETDYEQATISLNTSLVQLKQSQENVYPLYQTLKLYMGFPPENQFNVSYDTTQMMKDVLIDSTRQLQYENRIEYKQLQIEKELQHEVTNYYRNAIWPNVSAFYNYNNAFQNNVFADLYKTRYPNSLVGLNFSLPLFTGFARTNQVQKSKLQEQMLSWNEVNLKSSISAEYAAALASYKGNVYNMQKMQDNTALAKRVYFVVDLQYKQGIIPYLNVITAETNLRTAQLTYLNALFQVLSSKIDWQKAMGEISY
jgi:outer membrane protein TolC